jgi:hypothetical protein
MTVREARERPDLPTLTESLPLDEAELAAALAAAAATAPVDPTRAMPASRLDTSRAAASRVDIELPFKVRAVDEERRRDDDDEAGWSRRGTTAPPVTTPFAPLLDQLLDSGPGPFGLQVDVKHDHRVVGTWDIDISPRDPTDVHVSQAQAVLHACVAADGNPRETAAFLVLAHWWVNSADPLQLDQLYEGLTYAILDRFDALMQERADLARTMPPFVLYLVDGRKRKPRVFKAARLEHAILRALSDGHAVPGLDLHVAHGRSSGVSPISATLPSDLSLADLLPPDVPTIDADPDARPGKKAAPPPPVRRRADEVFVPERLSEENLRWMRKSSGEPS